jgi:diguanylate cyclase (GGDEF)-like protein
LESILGRRDGTPFCVIMLDLDDFSDVNDGHGHAAGDDILRGVARAMRVELRGSDVPARHGGEEFAVLLPRTELVEAAGVAERILEGIRNTCISVDGKEVRVTASVGVAEWSPHLSDVVARADDLLYVAKRAGKDAVALDGDPEPELVRPSGRGIRRRTSPIA